MSQEPQPYIQGTMNGKVVQNDKELTGRPLLHELLQKGDEVRTVTLRACGRQGLASVRFECAKDPRLGPASIIYLTVGTPTTTRPTTPVVSLGTEWSHFVHTQHMTLGWRLLVQTDYGPLF